MLVQSDIMQSVIIIESIMLSLVLSVNRAIGATTLSITALTIISLFTTLSITVSTEWSVIRLSVATLTVAVFCYAECRSSERH
jgi:hypothetical protein